MPIYTRKGDRGETSLFGGKRVKKFDLRVETYGTIDELNSAIGVTISQNQKYNSKIKNELEKIQNDLLDIGSALANPIFKPLPKLVGSVNRFEKLIDSMTGEMPPLKNFILPGGGTTGSFLHLSRTIARRAERSVVELAEREKIDERIIKYLNRLSDLLFTMSRFANFKEKQKETIWTRRP